jgi:hypothetical protein
MLEFKWCLSPGQRACRRHGIQRWPRRTLLKLQRALDQISATGPADIANGKGEHVLDVGLWDFSFVMYLIACQQTLISPRRMSPVNYSLAQSPYFRLVHLYMTWCKCVRHTVSA